MKTTKHIIFTEPYKAELLEVVSPVDAPKIYNQLCDKPKFPMGMVFDWREIP